MGLALNIRPPPAARRPTFLHEGTTGPLARQLAGGHCLALVRAQIVRQAIRWLRVCSLKSRESLQHDAIVLPLRSIGRPAMRAWRTSDKTMLPSWQRLVWAACCLAVSRLAARYDRARGNLRFRAGKRIQCHAARKQKQHSELASARWFLHPAGLLARRSA